MDYTAHALCSRKSFFDWNIPCIASTTARGVEAVWPSICCCIHVFVRFIWFELNVVVRNIRNHSFWQRVSNQRARLTWYLATFNTTPQSIKSQFKSNSIVIFRYITELHECSSECHRLYSKQIDVHLIVSSVYSARLLSNRLRRPRSHNLISLENVCCINELWQCNGALRFHWGWKYVHCTM